MIWTSIIFGFIALLIGSITDLKRREVYDYVSYGLMILAIMIAALESIIQWNYTIIAHAVMGFLIGVAIAYAMFYLGQWGGGDSKLLMGIGGVFGFNAFAVFGENNYWLFLFIAALICVGAVYGLLWSAFLAIKNRKTFVKHLASFAHRKDILIARRIILGMAVLLMVAVVLFTDGIARIMLAALLAMIIVIFYLWIIVKVIEETCMIKQVPVSKLTEGDWIYRDIFIGKKRIAGPKDLGISREQIAKLRAYAQKGKIRMIAVKEGIPFIPAFLIAFVITVWIYYVSGGSWNVFAFL